MILGAPFGFSMMDKATDRPHFANFVQESKGPTIDFFNFGNAQEVEGQLIVFLVDQLDVTFASLKRRDRHRYLATDLPVTRAMSAFCGALFRWHWVVFMSKSIT